MATDRTSASIPRSSSGTGAEATPRVSPAPEPNARSQARSLPFAFEDRTEAAREAFEVAMALMWTQQRRAAGYPPN